MRGPLRLVMLLALSVPVAGATPLLGAVVPDLPGAHTGDEAVMIRHDGDLSGWQLSDGEGTWTIPAGTVASGDAWFVGNASAWSRYDGPPPVGVFGTSLRLANDGDDVHLLDPAGREVDAFAWGEPPLDHSSPGMVWQRRSDGDGWLDDDEPIDWQTPRIHRIGESVIPPTSFDADAVTLYVSPDSSHDVITDLLVSARQRVVLHVYELRSLGLADALADAAGSVPTDVLVEGSPVGFDADDRRDTAEALRRIEAAGGRAWLAGNGRYDYHHLKVLVVDDQVAIQSENWVPSGVPADPSWGNRGWGIVLHGQDVADWFATWMADDRAAWDTERFDLASFDPRHRAPPSYGTPKGDHVPISDAITIAGPIRVTPVISPDHSGDPATDLAIGAALQAQERLWLQQLDFTSWAANDIGWQAPDAMREAVRQQGRAGLDVRVMASAPFRHDDTGNQEAMDGLAADGVATCTFAVDGLVLHNKGIIADDTVYVGSMNQNHHSRSENREAGVLVHDDAVADWYARRFQADWRSCPDAADALPVSAPAPWLFAGALLLAARRCCPWSLCSRSP